MAAGVAPPATAGELALLSRALDALHAATKAGGVHLASLQAAAAMVLECVRPRFAPPFDGHFPHIDNLDLAVAPSWMALLDVAASERLPKDVRSMVKGALRSALALILERGLVRDAPHSPVEPAGAFRTMFGVRVGDPPQSPTFQRFFEDYAWHLSLGPRAKSEVWGAMCWNWLDDPAWEDNRHHFCDGVIMQWPRLYAGVMNQLEPGFLEQRLHSLDVLSAMGSALKPARARALALHHLRRSDLCLHSQQVQSLDYLLCRAGLFQAGMTLQSWDDHMALLPHVPDLPQLVLQRHLTGRQVCPFLHPGSPATHAALSDALLQHAGVYTVPEVRINQLLQASEDAPTKAALLCATNKDTPKMLSCIVLHVLGCRAEHRPAAIEVLVAYMRALVSLDARAGAEWWLLPLLNELARQSDRAEVADITAHQDFVVVLPLLKRLARRPDSAKQVFATFVARRTRLSEALLCELQGVPQLFCTVLESHMRTTLHTGVDERLRDGSLYGFWAPLGALLGIHSPADVARRFQAGGWPASLCGLVLLCANFPDGVGALRASCAPVVDCLLDFSVGMFDWWGPLLALDDMSCSLDVRRAWGELTEGWPKHPASYWSDRQKWVAATMAQRRMEESATSAAATRADVLAEALGSVEALRLVLAHAWPQAEAQARVALRVARRMTAAEVSQPQVWEALTARYDASSTTFWGIVDAMRAASGF